MKELGTTIKLAELHGPASEKAEPLSGRLNELTLEYTVLPCPALHKSESPAHTQEMDCPNNVIMVQPNQSWHVSDVCRAYKTIIRYWEKGEICLAN